MFVSIDGLDCSGKTSVAKRLGEIRGWQVFTSPLPPLDSVSKELFETWIHSSRFYLFIGSNRESSRRVRKVVDNSEICIIDRYLISTVAYHIALEAVSVDKAKAIFDLIIDDFFLPDLIVDLQVDRVTQLDRAQLRGDDSLQRALMLSDSFQSTLRNALDLVIGWSRCDCVQIDSTVGDVNQVTEFVAAEIDNRLKQ